MGHARTTIVALASSAILGCFTARGDGLQCLARDFLGVADTPGSAVAITVEDGVAYVALDWEGWQALDVSDPAAPTVLSWTDEGAARALDVEAGVAYVLVPAGLKCFDVSDPSLPVELGVFGASGADAIVVVGSLALLTTGRDLVILDVSDPTSPTALSQLGGADPTEFIAVAGDYAYLTRYSAPYDGTLDIIDISDPTTPLLVSTIDIDRAASLDVADGIAAVGTMFERRLDLIDVSDPTQPAALSSALMPERLVRDVRMHGSLVFASCLTAGLQAVNITDPASPRLITNYALEQMEAWDAAIAGGVAYVANGEEHVLTIDISRATETPVLGQIPVSDMADSLVVADGIGYAAIDGLVRVLDFSDPTNPTELSVLDTPGSAYDLAVEGATLLVADTFGGLQVVNVADPAAPAIIGSLATDNALFVDLHGTLGFVATVNDSYESNWRIVDLSDPAAPALLGSVSGAGYSTVIVGGYAYVSAADAYSEENLRIFDITDPTAPALVWSESGRGARELVVAGDRVFATFGYCVNDQYCPTGLYAFDVTDPAAPVLLQTYYGAIDYDRIALAGDRLVVRENFLDQNGRVVVRDTATLEPVAYWAAFGRAFELDDSNILLSSTYPYAVQALDLSDCPCPADFDSNTVVDTRDFIAYLAAWSAQHDADCSSGDCSADTNQDGAVNTQDFIEFLTLWATGC